MSVGVDHSREESLQLKFRFALWILDMVREVIRREFGVRLSAVSVGRLLRRLGFTLHRPLYRAIEQDPALVERWRSADFPAIRYEAQECNALNSGSPSH